MSLILFSAALSACVSILAKLTYGYSVSPLNFLALRYSTASIIYACYILLRKPHEGIHVKLLLPLVLLGGSLLPLQGFTYFSALAYLPASSVTTLALVYPVHVAWISRVFLGERVSRLELCVLFGVVAGAVLVAGGRPHTLSNPGVIIASLNAIVSAVYYVVARRIVRDFSPFQIQEAFLFSANFVLVTVASLTGRLEILIPSSALIAVLVSGALTSIGPLLLLFGLRSVTATQAAVLGAFEVVVTVSLGVLVLGEVLEGLRFLGMVFVIVGVTLLQRVRIDQLRKGT